MATIRIRFLRPFSFSAFRICRKSYVAINGGINSAIVLLCILEPVHRRGWKGLSTFDCTNVKAVIIGAPGGGVKVAEEASKLQERKFSGEAEKVDIGKTRVYLNGERFLEEARFETQIELESFHHASLNNYRCKKLST